MYLRNMLPQAFAVSPYCVAVDVHVADIFSAFARAEIGQFLARQGAENILKGSSAAPFKGIGLRVMEHEIFYGAGTFALDPIQGNSGASGKGFDSEPLDFNKISAPPLRVAVPSPIHSHFLLPFGLGFIINS